MKKTTFVALLLLSTQSIAQSLDESLLRIESEWAKIYYNTPKQKQSFAFEQLIDKVKTISTQHSEKSEPIIWEAIIKATNADNQNGIAAIKSIHQARDLLIKAIKIDPYAMDGSAYLTLGTLYYMTPKWPIGFGDEKIAQQMLKKALLINPYAIENNYYYGDFLLTKNMFNEAKEYFKRTLSIPAREKQSFADNKIKELARESLKNTIKIQESSGNNLFASLFDPNSNK
jgi:tetratricopeptide (TPR) repeat protein